MDLFMNQKNDIHQIKYDQHFASQHIIWEISENVQQLPQIFLLSYWGMNHREPEQMLTIFARDSHI